MGCDTGDDHWLDIVRSLFWLFLLLTPFAERTNTAASFSRKHSSLWCFHGAQKLLFSLQRGDTQSQLVKVQQVALREEELKLMHETQTQQCKHLIFTSFWFLYSRNSTHSTGIIYCSKSLEITTTFQFSSVGSYFDCYSTGQVQNNSLKPQSL